jgi:hypothetical protein
MKMRYTAIKCDICGKDMTKDDRQYRFRRKDYQYRIDFMGVCSRIRTWTKLDMCENCYQDLESFVTGNNQLRKDGLNPIAATRQIHIGKIKKCKKQ